MNTFEKISNIFKKTVQKIIKPVLFKDLKTNSTNLINLNHLNSYTQLKKDFSNSLMNTNRLI